MDHSKNFNDPLPTTNKFCCYFNLKPALTCYVFIEFIVWIIFLLSSLNLQLEALEYTDLLELETALRKDLFYLLIFGPVEPIPHQNARSTIIFLNTVLLTVFMLYFVFTPLLLIGIIKSGPNFFIPYVVFDIILINLAGCFFIVGLIVWNLRMFWICFIFFAFKLNSSIGIFSLYKTFGGKVNDNSDISLTSGLSPVTTMESLSEAVDV